MADINFQQSCILVQCVGNDFKAHQLSPKVEFKHKQFYLLDKKQGEKLLRRRGDQFLELALDSISIVEAKFVATESVDEAEVKEEELNLDDYLK